MDPMRRVDVHLRTLSTTVLNHPLHGRPMFIVDILLQRKYQMLLIDDEGVATIMEEHHTAQDLLIPSLEIPLKLLARPSSCSPFLARKIHDCSVNLDDALCNHLASRIASYVADVIKQGGSPFHVSAEAVVVEEDVVDELEEEMMMMLMMDEGDDEDGVSRGASRSALKKLQKERFYMKSGGGGGGGGDGGGGGELAGTNCVVCLEEFCGGVELTRLPCSHVFHEQCVFRWLEKRTSCPLCRCEVV